MKKLKRFWPVVVPVLAATLQAAVAPIVFMLALAYGERNATNPPLWVAQAVTVAWCSIPSLCIAGVSSSIRRWQQGDRLAALLGFGANSLYIVLVTLVYFLLFVGPRIFGVH